ncbi:MAG: hypothetical protein ACR2OA_10415, partial [Rubripirellula sp.]
MKVFFGQRAGIKSFSLTMVRISRAEVKRCFLQIGMRHHDYQLGILARTYLHIHNNDVTVPSVGFRTFRDNKKDRYGGI